MNIYWHTKHHLENLNEIPRIINAIFTICARRDWIVKNIFSFQHINISKNCSDLSQYFLRKVIHIMKENSISLSPLNHVEMKYPLLFNFSPKYTLSHFFFSVEIRLNSLLTPFFYFYTTYHTLHVKLIEHELHWLLFVISVTNQVSTRNHLAATKKGSRCRV